jgi:hypothetical protein
MAGAERAEQTDPLFEKRVEWKRYMEAVKHGIRREETMVRGWSHVKVEKGNVRRRTEVLAQLKDKFEVVEAIEEFGLGLLGEPQNPAENPPQTE